MPSYNLAELQLRRMKETLKFFVLASKYIFFPNPFSPVWNIRVLLDSDNPQHWITLLFQSLVVNGPLSFFFSNMNIFLKHSILSYHWDISPSEITPLFYFLFLLASLMNLNILNFWDFNFLLLWLLISSYLCLKLLSHLKTQVNFNHSSLVSQCKYDNHKHIYSLFSIGYMLIIIVNRKFCYKIPCV